MSGNPETDDMIACWMPCGCLYGIHVLTGSEAGAYDMAAKAAKKGCRIETLPVRVFKERHDPWNCAEHTPKPKAKPVFGEPVP